MSWLFEQTAPAAGAHEALFDMLHQAPYEVFTLDFAPHEPEQIAQALEPEPSECEEDQEAHERARTLAVMLDAARGEARAEMRAELADETAAREAEMRARVERMASEFARDRQRFFAAAEREVVHLALAIARRVLAREIARETMPLAGTVRAALIKVQEETGTVLRVAPEEAEAWRMLLNTPGAADVQVIASERVRAGECVLETAVGRIELGVEVQMAEIERGFQQVQPKDGL